MSTRPAAVAGSFYPADADVLRQTLQGMLRATPASLDKPRALIVPHAGYRYSGAVAAAAYAQLRPGDYAKVLLLGSAHRVWLRGMALPCAQRFRTPLGEIAIAADAVSKLAACATVQHSDAAHADEHSLEVQLPFLQFQLGEFGLIPLLVGDCPPVQVAEVIETLLDEQTLLVVSTDLSHFHPYREAQALDAQTISRILAQTPTLEPEQACGAMPLNGFLRWLQQHGGVLQLLAHDNSGDHGGPVERVVGYASFRMD